MTRKNQIIKGPGTSVQSPALSQKHIGNIFHTAHYNDGHSILRLFDILPNASVATSEMKRDY